MNTFRIIDSPVGGLVVVANGSVLTGIYHEYHSPEPSPLLLGVPSVPGVSYLAMDGNDHSPSPMPDPGAEQIFAQTAEWLEAYFSGAKRDPLRYEIQTGTDFQRSVWAEVAEIPYGATRTYKDVAAALGNDAMGRAVGAAVRANPISIMLPGHRVVGAGGAVTGYAAGVAVKRALLELEASVLGQSVA
ncbi:methylated-DNA--[protein]-cysteine S-methyltransferase [Arthrobacter sp. JZ12]|uniref:methylated-DNA--[protein]-cysteine S-methyltransferase n=1 Tax=Arthrobacter sp. JZ12 TaxID=2654190 RepID=UPI002B49B73D|nr:methylated-DNA--[protein]-cysteine S-methyltransferase [Arthrobacter sp. JZ12]WRH25109.1 methylated-DNA--[protein]-cysteine S-methyltransferase [Arthrobacter sp. JZ12]